MTHYDALFPLWRVIPNTYHNARPLCFCNHSLYREMCVMVRHVRHVHIFLVFLLMAVPVQAHDGQHDAWYGSLLVPNHATWAPMMKCCDIDDCRPVLSRRTDSGHWQAYIDAKTFPDNPKSPPQGHAPDDWVDVRDEAIITDQGNPIGSAVACWWSRDVLCFIPGVEM